jgi:hypothetical protein
MATITAGQSASFTLDAFGYITVSSVIAGTLTGVSLAQTLKSNVYVSKLARTVYGPYGVPMEFVIASTDGPLTYTTTAGYSVGTGDVSSDTIWDAAGDVIYGTGADAATRLPIGTAGQVLTVNAGATAPEWADLPGSVDQFGVVHAGLMVEPYRVTGTGTPAGLSGPCLVESIMCLTVGTGGPVTIHDDVDAATAAQLRFTRAVGDMVAGTVYPLAGDGAAVVFTNGLYFTNSTSGVYIINAVPEV